MVRVLQMVLGTIKRSCDYIVASGRDISTYDQFVEFIQEEIKGIKIIPFGSSRNAEFEADVKMNSKPVKGTMQVRQVKWSSTEPSYLFFNSLSCFDCPTNCVH